MKKIVLKVSIMCGKCKSCIMTTISKFHGVVSITMDAEKSTATVVGDVDAVLIVKALRKKKRPAEVVSVGEPDKEKKEEKKPEPSKPLPSCCTACKAVVVWYDEPNPCSIL
ncbi:Heavy-metal-associated domain [Musa troglodytarum]|nr:Heavy-metal-associated domain [Musa troglodytarum]